MVVTNRNWGGRPAVILFHFGNGLSYRNLFYVWKDSVFLKVFSLQQSRFKKFHNEIFPFLVMLDTMHRLELDEHN